MLTVQLFTGAKAKGKVQILYPKKLFSSGVPYSSYLVSIVFIYY